MMRRVSHEPAPPVNTVANGLETFDRLWRRHGRTFWILHSIWALCTGVAVIVLAQERYGFVPWVVGCLGLTWVSTLYFGRPPRGNAIPSRRSRFLLGLNSYLVRGLYQETLFFLLPFYAYSVVFPSWNLVFPLLLSVLALLSCLDLVFDRYLRSSSAFGMAFFALVAFGALNLLLPVLFSIQPAMATPLAASLALVSAVPLAWRTSTRTLGAWIGILSVVAAFFALAFWLPFLVPPVPLRLKQVTFAQDIDRSSMEPIGRIDDEMDGNALGTKLVVIARVTAPTVLSTRVVLDWYHDGTLVRSSREVQTLAHTGGFRLWDSLDLPGSSLPPGHYRVVLRTANDRLFGAASLVLR